MNKNGSIACKINECKHHALCEDYCMLTQIRVGTTKVLEGGKCQSFIEK